MRTLLQREDKHLEQIFKELVEQSNVRSNLSSLRKEIKDEANKNHANDWLKNHAALVLGFLTNEDAKTRKNAALFLGDMKYQPAMEVLWESYQKERTLFVKSAYLTALANMDASSLVAQIKERLIQLQGSEIAEEERKHINEEIHALRAIVIQYEGITKHTFDSKGEEVNVLLITNRIHREVIRRNIAGKAELHPLGVLVSTKEVAKLWENRAFREMVFPVLETGNYLPKNPIKAAEKLFAAGLLELLKNLHREHDPFYFRIECKSRMTLEERSNFSKKMAEKLESISEDMLINSTSDYEIELRLIENKEGEFFPCVKCNTIKDMRFSYRRNSIAASIHPSTAALLAELAKPYLKEDAQIMDPFCGVGTMLIERNKLVPAREMYATDIFGEAIEKGRENAALAGARINFIHRDFFDFKHDYLFDEVITNMPVRGKRTREEMDVLYRDFFDKVLEIVQREATIIMYTNEIGFVKKQIRLHSEYKLLQETCIQSKTEFYLLIIGVGK